MTLSYRFKKEKLKDGGYVSRPRIFIELSGIITSVQVPTLIDTGCDTTVIPEGLAKAIGLEFNGRTDKIYAFRESSEVIHSSASISFLGKEPRQNITVKVPVLILLQNKENDLDEDVVLGIEGIFDIFDIIFKKSQNRIILKKVNKNFSITSTKMK